MESKKAIRSEIRKLKRELDEKTIKHMSDLIVRNVLDTSIYKDSYDILVYVNYNQEVQTGAIIEDALRKGKNVYVPKIFGDNMEFVKISGMNELLPGAYGILEPASDDFISPNYGLMILPGMAFDKSMHRIGYGGGYYDRYLARQNSIYKLAICYDFQLLDQIPYEEFDIKMDMIITQNGGLK